MSARFWERQLICPQSRRSATSGKTERRLSLGALLYFMITAVAPYSGETDAQKLVERVAHTPPLPLGDRQDGVSRELVAIVDKAMARDPAERYPDATALAEDLKRFQTGQLVRAREYSLSMLVVRWLRRHRILLSVCVAATLALLTTVIFSFHRIERARRVRTSARRR